MCGLVTIMCSALVVLRFGTVFGYPPPQQSCLQQCLPRCAQLLAHRAESGLPTCCNCRSLCVTSCHMPMKSEVSPKTPAHPQSPCASADCGHSDAIWRHIFRTCGSCRTKRKPRAPLREVALIARSVGIDLGDLTEGGDSSEGSRNNNAHQVWGLRLKSVTSGESTVSAAVAWDSTLPPGSCYLLTWQVEETATVMGNLLTNSTSTSLSLLPDAVYHLQVTSVSSGVTSECLLVNTHVQPQPLHPLAPSGVDVVAGIVAAIVTLVLLASALLAGRLRRQITASSKDVDLFLNNDRFKLYPPPITLVKVLTPLGSQPLQPQKA